MELWLSSHLLQILLEMAEHKRSIEVNFSKRTHNLKQCLLAIRFRPTEQKRVALENIPNAFMVVPGASLQSERIDGGCSGSCGTPKLRQIAALALLDGEARCVAGSGRSRRSWSRIGVGLASGGVLGCLGLGGGIEPGLKGGNLLLERGVLDLLGLYGGSNLGRLGLDGGGELGLELGNLASGLCPGALYAAASSTLNILNVALQISE